MELLSMHEPRYLAQWPSPFMPPEKIDKTKETVLCHTTIIQVHRYSGNASLFFNMKYRPEVVFFIYNYILNPKCCIASENRVHLSGEQESQMRNFLENLNPRTKERIREKFKDWEENENFQTIAQLIRKNERICPYCSMGDWNVVVYKCPLCQDGIFTFLEILHKPEYWTRLSANIYLSRKVSVFVIDDGLMVVNFCVNLYQDRKNVGMINPKYPRAIIYYGSLFATLFENCSNRENLQLPTLRQLCTHHIAVMYGAKLFKHNKTTRRAQFLANKLGCVKTLMEDVLNQFIIIFGQTDLCEKFA